jgi:hypothetical protein
MNLELFENWIKKKISHYPDTISNITFKREWARRDTKPAIEATIKTFNNRIGNIIFWDSGESDMWICDEVLNELEYLDSVIVSSDMEFDKAFEDFFIKLHL